MKDAVNSPVIESSEPQGHETRCAGACGVMHSGGGEHTIHPSGIILAGVHQWRASAFERRLPRTLVPIANRPLVEYPLGWLASSGASGVRICANSDTGVLRDHLGSRAANAMEIDYYEDHMPRGPAGCVYDASRDAATDDLLVVEGTVIPDGIASSDLVAAHRASGAALTVAVTRQHGSSSSACQSAPAGIYVFSPEALEQIEPLGYMDIKEMLVPRLYQRGLAVNRFELPDVPLRITGADSCFVATRRILTRIYATGEMPQGYARRGSAIVHESADIHAGARIEGPCLIGPNARVESCAIVVGPTTIGDGVRIAPGAVVCRSILWDGAAVEAGAYVDRAIMTLGASVAAGEAAVGRIVHAPAGRARARVF